MAVVIAVFAACDPKSDSPGSKESEVQTVTILSTNDIHGNYMPFVTNTGSATSQTGDPGRDTLVTFDKKAEIGGFAVLATAVKEIRESRENVLLLDAGDTFSDDLLGNLTQGEAVIKMMSALKYDYLSLGNHDFDYGRERTEELMQIAGFPFGAANITDLRTGKSIFDSPFVVKQLADTRIAIISLGYHNTNLTGNSDNMKDLEFRRGDEVLKEILPEVKEQADIIVLLSHQGTAVDRLTAEEFGDIDLIVGGHSHDLIVGPEKINNTYIVQAMADAAVLGEINLEVKEGKLSGVSAKHHHLWLSDFEKDPEMESLIQELRAPYRGHLEQKIATATEVIDRQYKSESPFEKIVGNLLREEYKAEISFLPGVGYGISLQGEFTREDLYRLFPHPPKVATLNLTGKQVKTTLEQTAINNNPKDKYQVVGGLLQSTGISYILDYTKPSGDRISDIQVNGENLDMEREYRIVTHSGMLNGLHKYDELGKGKNIEKMDIQLNEFTVKKFRELEEISSPANLGEIQIIE